MREDYVTIPLSSAHVPDGHPSSDLVKSIDWLRPLRFGSRSTYGLTFGATPQLGIAPRCLKRILTVKDRPPETAEQAR